MSDPSSNPPPRQSFFDRVKGPMTLLLIAIGGFALYYSMFFEKKTTYYRGRDARLIARLGQQVLRSIDITGRIVSNAAKLKQDEITRLYKRQGGSSDQSASQSGFDEITLVPNSGNEGAASHRFAERKGERFYLTFEGSSEGTDPEFFEAGKKPEPAAPSKQKSFARGTIELRQLIDTMVRQTAAGVFDTVFILDNRGDVIYQMSRQTADDSDAELKLLRLTELRVPRMFENEQVLKVSDLMGSSRQMAVSIGDRKYQFFSVPIRSTIHLEEDSHPDEQANAKKDAKAEDGVPADTWAVCGIISNADFRARSLAISSTLLTCAGAAVLLTVLCFPFMKMALSSAQQKVTLVDVILVGISGILIASVACLIVLDFFKYRSLENEADDQLDVLGMQIESCFRNEIDAAMANLDKLQEWAETRLRSGPVPTRNANLLALDPPLEFTKLSLPTSPKPYFHTVALIDKTGMQRVKWTVDQTVTPLISTARRAYFTGPMNRTRDYLPFDDRHIAIESVRSLTTGQVEVAFARRTDDAVVAGDNALREELPVIAMTMPTAPSIIDPIIPDGFGFAIVDALGNVVFHSNSQRNTVENIFAETDEDPQLRSAVAARQDQSIRIRYLGDDYSAFVHPLRDLPWTLITFREQHTLRTLNTEALLITLFFILLLTLALLAFIGLLLLFRPRYRAQWLWPDPNRAATYAELAALYVFLIAVAVVLLLTHRGAALLEFPLWLIPLALVVAYLYLRARQKRARRIAFLAIAAVCAARLLMLIWSARQSVMLAIAASILLLIVVLRTILRPKERGTHQPRNLQTALPLCYVTAAFLLVVLMGVIPAAACFQVVYATEVDSYVKWIQIKLAGDMQNRWWRIEAEFSDERGKGKLLYRESRWRDTNDIYSEPSMTTIQFDPSPEAAAAGTAPFPATIASILPHYSDAPVKLRELVQDRAADELWWWTRSGPRLELHLKNSDEKLKAPFRIESIASTIPKLFPSIDSLNRWSSILPFALALLVILIIAFLIARFVARRIFLVDLMQPMRIANSYVGLQQVICHPCDDDSARRLFGAFRKIDLRTAEGLELARTAPQSFPAIEGAVFVDGVSHTFATGEESKLLRGLLERLTNNTDRTVVLRPTSLSVITKAFLEGDDQKEWSDVLFPFVWVNWSQVQVVTTGKQLTLSGAVAAVEVDIPADTPPPSAFETYFDRFTDTRGAILRVVRAETEGDPYLHELVKGLGTAATSSDQVLDEIGERAEEYYGALWRTCSPQEQLVLMQLAQTGLVNGKARKHVRRLLARGQLQRDPQLRIMNETFRRFILAQSATSTLATELEHDLAGDAWRRFRAPFFGAVAIVLLFFFITQRQMFDSTIALVTGLAASLPAFVRMVSGFGGAKSER